jgi:hypothetical protein
VIRYGLPTMQPYTGINIKNPTNDHCYMSDVKIVSYNIRSNYKTFTFNTLTTSDVVGRWFDPLSSKKTYNIDIPYM